MPKIGERALIILAEKLDRGALVPGFGSVWREVDGRVENLGGEIEIGVLDETLRAAEQQIDGVAA